MSAPAHSADQQTLYRVIDAGIEFYSQLRPHEVAEIRANARACIHPSAVHNLGVLNELLSFLIRPYLRSPMIRMLDDPAWRAP